MHLGNGIICPVTGVPMLMIAGVTAFYAIKKKIFKKDKIMETVMLTAFVFGLQMINFGIPTTGSSGHIIGGVLLAAILSPPVAFLSMCSILIIQALFFADGGLLAFGCNIFNMGVLACFVAYPLFYKPLADRNKPVLGAIVASILALQMGSIAAALECFLSGSIQMSGILNFMVLMQGIHLPIGVVEGILTGGVIIFAKSVDMKKFSYTLGAVSLVLAGVISQYASTKPDGLEWSLLNIPNSVIAHTQGSLYTLSKTLQVKLATIVSSFPPPFGNIMGLIATAVLMFILCKILSKYGAKENAAQV